MAGPLFLMHQVDKRQRGTGDAIDRIEPTILHRKGSFFFFVADPTNARPVLSDSYGYGR